MHREQMARPHRGLNVTGLDFWVGGGALWLKGRWIWECSVMAVMLLAMTRGMVARKKGRNISAVATTREAIFKGRA